MSVDWIGYGYATLVASGGVVGYVKAGGKCFPFNWDYCTSPFTSVNVMLCTVHLGGHVADNF